MYRATVLALRSSISASRLNTAVSPLELFTKVQLGATPTSAQARNFLVAHFGDALSERGLTDARLSQLDSKKINDLLKQVLFERYLSVPFTPLAFDLEFTSTPKFSTNGPSEDIIEIGIFAPDTGKRFSRLIKPGLVRDETTGARKKVLPEVEALTGITNKMLSQKGVTFAKAWADALQFIDEASASDEAWSRVLLLSHGGKMADVSMLRWASQQVEMPVPSTFVFGDTFHTVRDLHRRRPVTKDKMPPSWGLVEMAHWLNLKDIPESFDPARVGAAAEARSGALVSEKIEVDNEHGTSVHRAAVDAKLTWDITYHTLDRYGDASLKPRQQLISRFFDDAGKAAVEGRSEVASTSQDVDDLDFLADV